MNGKGRNGNMAKKGKSKTNGGNGRRNGNCVQSSRVLPIITGGENVRPLRQAETSFSGSDFLTTVTVLPEPSISERVLQTMFISPSYFTGTRLAVLSQMWERYRFTSFRIRYVPAVPTTLACQLVIYFDTDPLDSPLGASTADVLVRQAVAHTGAQQFNFNVHKSVPLPQRSDDQLYYTGDIKLNDRFALQAKAYVIQVTDPLNFNGDALEDDVIAGSLYIDWTCKFQLPQINPAVFSPASELTISVSETLTFGEPLSKQVTDLEPFANYLIFPQQAINNSGVPGGVLSLQPKTSLREDYAPSTNKVDVTGSSSGNVSLCQAQTNYAGVLDYWLTTTISGTVTNIRYLLVRI